MWKWILKAVAAASSDPRVQAWVKRKARDLASRVRINAEKKIAGLHETAGIPTAVVKLTQLVKTDKDVLRPGQVAIVDGKAIRIVRLISSHATETIYEGVAV